MTLHAERLTLEYRINPLGTDVRKPRFSWQLRSSQRGTLQEAYRIQVAYPDARFETLLWDTDIVHSEQSLHIEYEGPSLQSRTRYAYRVKVWDNSGNESDWSETSYWETAMLKETDWQAKWITPAASSIPSESKPAFLLRKSFEAKAKIQSARIYASSRGVYELYLNGNRVGDELLSPGWTSYHHRLQYQTYDVTAEISNGFNGIGIMLADGWYKGRIGWKNDGELYGSQRAALLQLHMVFEDGTEQIITSDESWKSALGPVLCSSIYDGECYDARLERSGWSQADYDDGDWSGTDILSYTYSNLVAQENWPSRVTEKLAPVELLRTPAGEVVLDMGQNMVGRIRMKVEAPAGTKIELQHAEVLDKDGNFYTGNLRSAKQTVTYIAGGYGQESYVPFFTFQGFRYVKVEGYPGQDQELPLERFIGEVIHSDMERAGEFDSSHPLINQLQQNIVWGQRGNFLDVPTDCPQRDERLGWTGDAQVFIRTATFNYHVGPFFTKWLRDLKADQLANGGVPFVIPQVLDENSHSSAAWGDAAVICPWTTYLIYDDKRLLAEQYDSMKSWIRYIREQGDNEFLWNTGFHFGDWLGLDAQENSYVGATPRDLIATAYYAYSTRLVRDSAVVLGRAEDVREYSELLNRIEAAFGDEFLTPAGRLAAPTQTAHTLALMFDLVKGAKRERVARELNQMIVDNDFHLTTGFVGTPYLCLVLSDNGYHDTAVKILLQESYPSWLYAISKGATTIWEHWDGIKPDGSFWSDDMNSYNHYAYGAIGDWLYRVVAGLDMDETEPGFKRISIKPRLACGKLTSAKASYKSMYGPIGSGWNLQDDQLEVNVQIPANTTAVITLPGAGLDGVQEGGHFITEGVEGIHSYTSTKQGVQITAGSGNYRFVYPVQAAEN